MGKKGDKTVKDKLHTQPSEDSSGKTPEPYKCVGNFVTDFKELYRELYPNNYVVPITPIGKRETFSYSNEPSVPTQTAKRGGKEDKKAATQQIIPQEPEQILPEEKEIIDKYGFKPKNFSIKPNNSALKPCIYVETDNIDKVDNITEVLIRRWKIDSSILSVLESTLQLCSRLSTLSLWKVGLDSEMVTRLSEVLTSAENIKTLRLENNTESKDENYYELIGPGSHLTKLYLRHCQLTPIGAKLIADSLQNTNSNSKLLILDLTNNKLGDHGATYLAKALKINRSLLSLNMSNCDIGDEGCMEIAQAISQYYLSTEEIFLRRQLMSENAETSKTMTSFSRASEWSSLNNSPPPSRHGDPKDHRPTSVRSSIKDDKTNKKDKGTPKGKKDAKEEKHEKLSKTKKEEKGSKKTTALIDPNKSRGKGRSPKGTKGGTISDQSSEVGGDSFENLHPLLSKVEEDGPGKLRIIGNLILVFLNLSRNRISNDGLRALSNSILFQSNQSGQSKSQSSGLVKIILSGNRFSDTEEFNKINQILLEKERKSKTPTGENEP